ncbi:hypothetical protein AOX55_00006654 (plasmid) [Sinorhizobium fredii CCBAU 25509]|nr:hypothetical protein AOX55_00006654 [Sinorhizobium fredii CCBAU 25509]
MEERKTGAAFQFLNSLADGWLRNPEDLGGAGRRAIGHHGMEDFDLAQVHLDHL